MDYERRAKKAGSEYKKTAEGRRRRYGKIADKCVVEGKANGKEKQCVERKHYEQRKNKQ